MDAWLGIGAVLLGGIVGWLSSYLTARFQLRFQETRERKKLPLEKYQYFYETLSLYSQVHMFILRDNIKGAIPGELRGRNPLLSTPLEVRIEAILLEKLRMPVGIYRDLIPEEQKTTLDV